MRRVLGEKKCELNSCKIIFQFTSQKPNKRFCCRKCVNEFLRGVKLSEETKRKMREFRSTEAGKQICSEAGKKSSALRSKDEYTRIGKEISKAKKGKPNLKLRGENHHNWKGGVSVENKTARQVFMSTLEYKNWRREVFERDNYSCIQCNIRSKRGIKVVLHADHIKPYSLFPDLRLNVDNGRTLCEPCHRKTETWGGGTRNGSNKFN